MFKDIHDEIDPISLLPDPAENYSVRRNGFKGRIAKITSDGIFGIDGD
jgi:hypothetical protein